MVGSASDVYRTRPKGIFTWYLRTATASKPQQRSWEMLLVRVKNVRIVNGIRKMAIMLPHRNGPTFEFELNSLLNYYFGFSAGLRIDFIYFHFTLCGPNRLTDILLRYFLNLRLVFSMVSVWLEAHVELLNKSCQMPISSQADVGGVSGRQRTKSGNATVGRGINVSVWRLEKQWWILFGLAFRMCKSRKSNLRIALLWFVIFNDQPHSLDPFNCRPDNSIRRFGKMLKELIFWNFKIKCNNWLLSATKLHRCVRKAAGSSLSINSFA